MRRVSVFVSLVIICIGIFNFASFAWESEQLGGDALNGYQHNGHFFVVSHGQQHEVPESVWQRNRWQGMSLTVTHPAAMLAMAYLLFQFIFPAMLYRSSRAYINATTQVVRESGTPIVSLRCGGRIGLFSAGGPVLRVTVYPGGVVIKPVFMTEFAIPVADIRMVIVHDTLRRHGIEIQHGARAVASPIYLACGSAPHMIAALNEIRDIPSA